MPDFRALLRSDAYSFLRGHPRLGRRVLLLAVGGSYGYGTQREGSDIDLRGAALQSPSDLLGLTSFEQYVDAHTDTVIYGFNKLMRLLIECNPGCLELLGLPEENYLILSPAGQALLRGRRMFLSKQAIRTFGGSAAAQLRRLENAAGAVPPASREARLREALPPLCRAAATTGRRGAALAFEAGEPVLDIDARVPLRDLCAAMDAVRPLLRAEAAHPPAKEAPRLRKAAMHAIRTLMTGIDILERGEIIACRREEHALLMSILRGDYADGDGAPLSRFYELWEEYSRRFREAAAKTALPDGPDTNGIGALMERVNRDSIEEVS